MNPVRDYKNKKKPQREQISNGVKIIFLGTNGWYNTDTGNTICTLIETKDYFIILDAGNGIYKISQHIKNEKPIYLFLSHFHLEHIFGLHLLNSFNFKQGISIYSQRGTRKIFKKIINTRFTMPFERLPYTVKVHELPKEKNKLPFPVESKFLVHASPCLGFRFDLEGKIITYCPDTAFCQNAIKLAKNADLLIAECALKVGGRTFEAQNWPHLNPETAAKIAKEARAKKLALIHFDASIYQTLKERKEAEKFAKKIFKNSFATIDDMEIKI